MDLPDLSLDKIFKRGAEFYHREIIKMQKEKNEREEFLQKIDDECLAAKAKFETLAARLNELNPETIKDPFETHESLLFQKTRIDELLKMQDDVIANCIEELNKHNFQYENVQRRQFYDINELAGQIEHQLELVEDSYRSSTKLLEETIENERTTIRLAVTQKWQDFHDVQQGHEDLVRSKQDELQQFHANEIDRIRLEHEEATRAIRTFLEEQDQSLFLDWQTNREDHFVFKQKEDYFKQIAKRQIEENNLVFGLLRRVTRVRMEKAQGMRNRIKKLKEKKVIESARINTEMKIMQSRILDIAVRSENAARVNEKIYFEMFDMNEEKCNKLLEQVLQIDKMLTEQQLGVAWVQPPMNIIKRNEMPSYNKALEIIKENPILGKYDSIAHKQEHTETKKNIIKIILKRISDKAGFLVENKLLSLLQHEVSEENLSLVVLDHVFNALDIQNDKDIILLKEFFEPYMICHICDKKLLADDAPCYQTEHKYVIESPNILKALSEFVTANIAEYDDKLPVTFEARLSKKNYTVSRLINHSEVINFFENFRNVISTDKVKLWSNIRKGLSRYTQFLHERIKLDKQCFNLRRQNTELQYLLEKQNPDKQSQNK